MDIVKLEKVRKILKKVPYHIRDRLMVWAESVELKGIREVRKIKGFHDELLKGERRGQRSVRLSKSWRVIYREKSDRIINLIIVEEVHKHRY